MKMITVFTDGSKYPQYTHIGIGAYCRHEDKEYRLSLNLDQEMFKTWCNCVENVSNPTAELSAAASVLYEFSLCNKPAHIEIVADYNGVKNWSEGTWQVTKPYIRKLILLIKLHQLNIESKGGKVTFRHISGHQKGNSPDAMGNNASDKMAKSLTQINEIKQLIQLINE